MNRPAGPLAILVTGASSGIGRAVAVRLAGQGQYVYAAARRQDVLAELAARQPGIVPVPLDLSDASSIAAAASQVLAGTDDRGPDVLVNVAGVAILGPFESIPVRLLRREFEINVFGTIALTQAFLPAMRRRRAGRIVNVSSVLGRFALPGTGLYSASKFAVEAVSDALRVELAPFGVAVVLVEPGVTDTGLYAETASLAADLDGELAPYRAILPSGTALPRSLLRHATPAEQVASTVVQAATASRPRARYVPGARNQLNVRLLATLPTRLADSVKTRITSAG